MSEWLGYCIYEATNHETNAKIPMVVPYVVVLDNVTHKCIYTGQAYDVSKLQRIPNRRTPNKAQAFAVGDRVQIFHIKMGIWIEASGPRLEGHQLGENPYYPIQPTEIGGAVWAHKMDAFIKRNRPMVRCSVRMELPCDPAVKPFPDDVIPGRYPRMGHDEFMRGWTAARDAVMMALWLGSAGAAQPHPPIPNWKDIGKIVAMMVWESREEECWLTLAPPTSTNTNKRLKV